MKIKKQITDNGEKTARDHIRHQLDLGQCPYPCEKREVGASEVVKIKKIRAKKEKPRVVGAL